MTTNFFCAFALAFTSLQLSSTHFLDYDSTPSSSSSSCEEEIGNDMSVDEKIIALAAKTNQFKSLKFSHEHWEYVVKAFNSTHGLPSFSAKHHALNFVADAYREFFDYSVRDETSQYLPDGLLVALAVGSTMFSPLVVGDAEWIKLISDFNFRYGFPSDKKKRIAIRHLKSREMVELVKRKIVTLETITHPDFLVVALSESRYPFNQLQSAHAWRDAVKNFNSRHGLPSFTARKEALARLDSSLQKFFDENISWQRKIFVTMPSKENISPNRAPRKRHRVSGEHLQKWEEQRGKIKGSLLH